MSSVTPEADFQSLNPVATVSPDLVAPLNLPSLQRMAVVTWTVC